MAGGNSRVFVTPQAGRSDRTRAEGSEEPWGSTASRSHFRPFDAAEAQSCRGSPALTHSLPSASLVGTPQQRRSRSTTGSAMNYSVDSASKLQPIPENKAASCAKRAGASKPGYLVDRPIPQRPFCATTTYRADQLAAQEARKTHFSGRDEFAPLSKQKLLELAHARFSRDDAKSASSREGSVSCFTVADSDCTSLAKSCTSLAKSSLTRSSSEPSLAPSPSLPRVPSASSQVPGGIARRRRECQMRSPGQWEPDRVWYVQRLQEDGPTGLHTGNHVSSLYGPSLGRQMDRMHGMSPLLGGTTDEELGLC